VNPAFWQGKRVLLTGHTGFKGSWLALWLHQLGARVTGFALTPPTTPNLFEVAQVGETLDSIIGDIRDPVAVSAAFARSNPEIIFHLAAQPLVSEGYQDPVGTYTTNVMGTLNIMEAARHLPDLQAMVVITTDKCYENAESLHAYTETDPLGGHDPYSSSKACTDIAVASWRRSFFNLPRQAGVASARAGNVIGGGDWAKNRLVPDLLRAFAAGQAAQLRHIQAVRPWQYVLEPLAGYLQLAESMATDKSFATAWNFGPELEDCVSVEAVADQLVALWPGTASYVTEASTIPHEAGLLRLDASRAKHLLKWRPRWHLPQALQHTVDWQLAWLNGSSMRDFCRQQINLYQQTEA
jgi:CDP-glucose 4,6-dehydratase